MRCRMWGVLVDMFLCANETKLNRLLAKVLPLRIMFQSQSILVGEIVRILRLVYVKMRINTICQECVLASSK